MYLQPVLIFFFYCNGNTGFHWIRLDIVQGSNILKFCEVYFVTCILNTETKSLVVQMCLELPPASLHHEYHDIPSYSVLMFANPPCTQHTAELCKPFRPNQTESKYINTGAWGFG